MRCILVHEFGGPEVLQLGERPDLEPGPGELVVQLEAIGVNPVDTYVRSGASGPRSFPYTPGSDGAGMVIRVGEGVPRQVGERVYLTGSLSGTYAEQALCSEDQIQPLPPTISARQGAALFVPYYTAYRALFQRGRARPGESVFIHGASGAVGLAACQFAKAAGLRVIGTGGTEDGRRLALENGAEHVLDHHAEGYLEEAREWTGGGPALILEMLANVNLQADLDLVARYGRIVVIGNRGSLDGFNARAAMIKDADVRGMLLFNAPPEDMAEIHAAVGAGLGSGTLRPIVSHEFPLEQAAEAHRTVLQSGTLGKIVLLP